MCIKVSEDDALRAKNRPRVDAAEPGHEGEWEAIAERCRAMAGAAAAILSASAERALTMVGKLPGSGPCLAQAAAAIARPGDAGDGNGIGVRKSWGAHACPRLVVLQRRFGLRDLAMLEWVDGPAQPPAWIALVNLARGGPQRRACAQLRAIGESLRERCQLQTRMRAAMQI